MVSNGHARLHGTVALKEGLPPEEKKLAMGGEQYLLEQSVVVLRLYPSEEAQC